MNPTSNRNRPATRAMADASPTGGDTAMPYDGSTPLDNPRHEAFVRAYIASGVGSEAYKEAYPKARKWRTPNAAEVAASALLRTHKAAIRVQHLQAQAAERATMSLADVCAVLEGMVRGEVKESVKTVTKDGQVLDLKRTNRIGAIALLAKLRGWEKAQSIDLTTGGQPLVTTIVFRHESAPDHGT